MQAHHHDDHQDQLHDHDLHVKRLREYWLGSVDARPLALYRVVFGLVVLGDALDRLRDFRAFYTDDGIFPRAFLTHLQPDVPLQLGASLVGSPASAALLFAVGIFGALALTLGLLGRWPSLLVWIYALTIGARAGAVGDGGDSVITVMAFWTIFTDADAAFSLRRGPRLATVRALPVRLAECQVMLIYFIAGLRKLNGAWLDGTALFHVLQSNDFARPIGMALLDHPSLCKLLTHATLLVELGFLPLALAWPRRGRVVAALAAAGLHLGIYALMRVGMFSFVMLASLCLFVPPSLLGAPGGEARAVTWPRRWRVVVTLACALFALAAASGLLRRRTPRPIMSVLGQLGLLQGWGMFEHAIDTDGYWSGQGRDSDGKTVDVLGELAPGVLPQATAAYSRWYKLREGMVEEPSLRLLLLDWMCRHHHGARLVDATLERWQRPTRAPGEPPHAFARVDETTWQCRARGQR